MAPETAVQLIMQKSFSDLEYAAKKKLTRRDRFFAKIDNSVTPWSKLHELIEPHYPKVGGAGRAPIDLARMPRMYGAGQCVGLSDEGIEDAIYDSRAIRAFVGIDERSEGHRDVFRIGGIKKLFVSSTPRLS